MSCVGCCSWVSELEGMRQAGELAAFLHSLDPPEDGAEGKTDNPLAGAAPPVREVFGADA